MNEKKESKHRRIYLANELLRKIGGCGCKFFNNDNVMSFFDTDSRGRIWFHDSYSCKAIYTHSRGRWLGFSHGGTMKTLIEGLRDFIRTGEKLRPVIFGPWPRWVCGGDLWGYGGDMLQIRSVAMHLGIIPLTQAAGREEG